MILNDRGSDRGLVRMRMYVCVMLAASCFA